MSAASQTLSASFAPTVPAVGNPRSNTWTLTLTDQASGQSAGSYELVFSDAPPNAGGLTGVTSLGRRRRSPPPTTPATGDMVLDLGNQQITIGLGSTSAAARSTFAADLDLLLGRRQPRRQRGRDLHRALDRREGVPPRHLLERLLQGHLPDPGRRRAEPERAQGARQPVLRHLAGLRRRCSSGTPATGRRAAIEGFAREQSTTDIANELTQLIQTQRAYSSNAKIIQTVDEMLQETTNLKR